MSLNSFSLYRDLAEPGLLYRRLNEMSDPVDKRIAGLVGQSLKYCIKSELLGYLNLVAALESEIRVALENEQNDGDDANHVSLTRCCVWMQHSILGLRLLTGFVDAVIGQKGGELISTISKLTLHGDEYIIKFGKKTLSEITKPFFGILQKWICSGQLNDPYSEFFVTITTKGVDSSSVWNNKYIFEASQVPSFMSKELAFKVFKIGKTLNFLRSQCDDAKWVDEYAKTASKDLTYDDLSALESTIDTAYLVVSKYLLDLMKSKFPSWSICVPTRSICYCLKVTLLVS